MPQPETDSQPESDAELPAPAPHAELPAPAPHAVLRYTTLRLALFIVALAVLWLARVRDGVLLVAIALVISGLASYVLLARHRDAMSAQLHAAQQRRRARSLAAVSREDVDETEDADDADDARDTDGAGDSASTT